MTPPTEVQFRRFTRLCRGRMQIPAMQARTKNNRERGRTLRSSRSKNAAKSDDGEAPTVLPFCTPEKFSFFARGLELTCPRQPRSNDDGGRTNDAITPDTLVCYVCSFVYVAFVRWESGDQVRTQRLDKMRWLRSRLQSCAQLALFALAVQMVLSCGHMHRDDLGLSPLPVSDGIHSHRA